MIRLTKGQVLQMHAELIAATGGMDLYPSLEQKAARLGYGLIKNHAMIDGNKRIGAHAMLVFLALNGIRLQYTQEELYTIILDVAAGKSSQENLLTWIEDHKRR